MEKEYGKIDLSMVADFTDAHAPSGAERNASRVMKKYLDGYVDEIMYDNLGSIIGLKKGSGNGPKLMIMGHIDEIGFVITKIEDNGFLRFAPLGGWWGHVLPAKRLVINTRDGKEIIGMVGNMAPHGLKPEVRNKVQSLDEMFIDLGVNNKEEVAEIGVRVGDFITPDTKFEVMNNPNFLMAKAWDDRVGALIATEVVRKLQGQKHECDVYAVGSVQEEVGLRGAKTATHLVNPDVAFAIDVTIGDDTPGAKNNTKLGVGVTLGLKDSSVLSHRGLFNCVSDLCEEMKIATQVDTLVAGGTDSGEIHKAYNGVVNMTLSIPTRYIHSHRGVLHRKDYVDTVNLLVEFAKRLDNKLYQELQIANR
ncbi:MAG: M42 family metallopeptidase [Erysipelotrichaceae bacterium]